MKKSVVILEDESIIALMLKKFLISQNHVITGIAKDAQTAIELVKNSKPDLIILDVHIKGNIDGIEAYKIIKGFYKGPTIFLTGNSLDILNREKNQHGYYVLEKPVSLSDLKKTIDLICTNN